MQFLATHKAIISASKLAALQMLVNGSRYSISIGDAKHNKPYVTLCFAGPLEQAEQSVIDEFRRICG